MKIDENLSSLMGYLCGDGYVIYSKNPKYKYYYIGLRNTNLHILEDFQNKFEKVFGLRPIITKNKDKCKIQNKEICLKLIENFGSFYSDKWIMPKMNKKNKVSWIRSYYDCDGWIGLVERKDRKIGLESINSNGIKQIQKELTLLGIDSSLKKRSNRNIWSLIICGKDDIQKFSNVIGFNHPKKSNKLKSVLESYVDYNWKIPDKDLDFMNFITDKGKVSSKRKEVRFNSILKSNMETIQERLLKMKIKTKLRGPWKNPYGSMWYCLSMKLKDYKSIHNDARKSEKTRV